VYTTSSSNNFEKQWTDRAVMRPVTGISQQLIMCNKCKSIHWSNDLEAVDSPTPLQQADMSDESFNRYLKENHYLTPERELYTRSRLLESANKIQRRDKPDVRYNNEQIKNINRLLELIPTESQDLLFYRVELLRYLERFDEALQELKEVNINENEIIWKSLKILIVSKNPRVAQIQI
jgi:hypothetical protein